jgi:hypothetical protein
MPRRSPRASVTTTVNELLGAVSRLAGAVQHALSLPQVRAARAGVTSSAHSFAAAASATGKKIGAKVKAAWARYTPKQRAARVKKMLAARGLKPKAKRAPTAKGKKLKRAIKASWAKMTPEQRAARIAKMQKGRGLKPKAAAVAAR